MESEIEKLHNKVGYHAQNEVILEEKLNNLQNGHDMLVKKEEVLDNKVKCVEDVNGVLTHQEVMFREITYHYFLFVIFMLIYCFGLTCCLFSSDFS